MGNQRLLFIFVAFSIALFSSIESWAFTEKQVSAIENLMQQEHRPTVAQVVAVIEEAFGKWPESNVFFEYQYQNQPGNIPYQEIPRSTFRNFETTLPESLTLGIESIAALEKAYPGAVFAFLGRDSVYISEIFEAIFMQIPAEKRVFRLNASTPSFAGHTDELMWQFANTNGLTEDILFKRPYLMLDATSFGQSFSGKVLYPQSQSTLLTYGVYQHLIQQGLEPQELVRWVNFVNVSPRNGNNGEKYRIDRSGTGIEEYFADMTRHLEVAPTRIIPPRIITLHRLQNLSYDKLEWHSSFGELRTEEDGVIRGNPPASNPSAAPRLTILTRVFELYSIARKRDVLSELVAAAEELNYDYTKGLQVETGGDSNSRLQTILAGIEERRLKIEEERRLAEERERRRAEIRAQRRTEREATDIENLAQRQNSQIQIRLNNVPRLTGQRLASALIDEAGLQFDSRFDYELASAAQQLPLMTVAKHANEGTYFSSNGTLLQETVLNDFFGRAASLSDEFLPFDANERVSKYLNAVTVLYDMSRLSPKDLRRLVLFSMAKMDSEAASFALFEGLIAENDTLRNVLIERAEVYLTSGKNKSIGQTIYKAFVQKEWLPEPDCKDLLT